MRFPQKLIMCICNSIMSTLNIRQGKGPTGSSCKLINIIRIQFIEILIKKIKNLISSFWKFTNIFIDINCVTSNPKRNFQYNKISLIFGKWGGTIINIHLITRSFRCGGRGHYLRSDWYSCHCLNISRTSHSFLLRIGSWKIIECVLYIGPTIKSFARKNSIWSVISIRFQRNLPIYVEISIWVLD